MKLTDLNITKTKVVEPPRIVVYGSPKVGKTTFAASAPAPILLDLEGGSKHIEVPRVEGLDTYGKFVDVIKALGAEKHEYKTLVIDSVDWLERLIQATVASEHDVESIEGIGYGKGYQYAVEKFNYLLLGLEKLRTQGMAIVFIGHDQIQKFEDPLTDSYDRHTLKLHKKLEALLVEWSDAILFATKKVYTRKEEAGFNKETVKAVTDNKRIMYTDNSPAALAGNRYGLPLEMELNWNELQNKIKG